MNKLLAWRLSQIVIPALLLGGFLEWMVPIFGEKYFNYRNQYLQLSQFRVTDAELQSQEKLAHARWEKTHIQWLKLQERTQKKKDLAQMLTQIRALAEENKLKLESISPSLTLEKKVKVHKIRMELTGNYFSVGLFLDKLQDSISSLYVHRLGIKKHPNGLQVQFEFWQNGESSL